MSVLKGGGGVRSRKIIRGCLERGSIFCVRGDGGMEMREGVEVY
jgi:hypothetical protein